MYVQTQDLSPIQHPAGERMFQEQTFPLVPLWPWFSDEGNGNTGWKLPWVQLLPTSNPFGARIPDTPFIVGRRCPTLCQQPRQLATSSLRNLDRKWDFRHTSFLGIFNIYFGRGSRVAGTERGCLSRECEPSTTKYPLCRAAMHVKISRAETSSHWCGGIAQPLSSLTKKKASWKWSEEEEKAFQTLKQCLVSPPFLKQADFSKHFLIRTDASNYALGGVLLQGEDKEEYPVEFASRLLNPAEKNYSTTEREALAMVLALNKFRGYIDRQASL
ncbi:retrovirus-related Pol polyprotein from transposon 17.6 [Trichonephila clavipes]|nr:retrovirus-related Pol polyprotein from transposon 17.6 [Trichonephila clavipes]